ncbi:hypothetical protein GCM10022244_10340 [Streptomyces gulbargensis]|uniref:Uncharacterized protein n=1 Tax=Streptomyces gulbargensis TaxID=364901 RepID=A0ABP7LJ12_9ACTN
MVTTCPAPPGRRRRGGGPTRRPRPRRVRQPEQPPHWHGPPDWQPQPQPEPHPQAPSTGSRTVPCGACAEESVVIGESAMGSLPHETRIVSSPIACPPAPAHQRRTGAPRSYAPSTGVSVC